MNELGTWVLRLSLLTAVIAFLLIIFNRRSHNEKHPGVIAGLVSCAGVLLSTVLLLISLMKGIFSVEYVFHNTDKTLPLIYKISALWSGSSGSMLFWSSIFAALLVIIYFKNSDKTAVRNVFGVILIIIINFMFVVSFINNPFKYVTPETDGFGLNPALQSVGMVFHPPIVIIGFSFFFIAFAYLFNDLKDKTCDNKALIRKWTLWGWVLLTAGIITGGIWAYSELGWGGYWAWDPIENSSLVNWLLATAFLHSFSRKDPENKHIKSNFVLLLLTVFTILIGTFIARSGILKSVHAYSSQSVTIFFGAFLVILAVTVIVLYLRYRRDSSGGGNIGENRSEEEKEKRQVSFFNPVNITTIMCVTMAAVIFGGTILPLFGGFFPDGAVNTPEAFYDYTFGIFGLLILLLVGVCPGLFSGKRLLLVPGGLIGVVTFIMVNSLYNYGVLTKLSLAVCAMLITNLLLNTLINYKKLIHSKSYLAFFILHLSIILMALGITGSRGMTVQTEKILAKNDIVNIQGYTLTFQKLKWREEQGKTVAIAVIEAQGSWGKKIFMPELAYYHKRNINHSRAVIEAKLNEDLYLIFEGLDESDRILLKVMVLKWISMVWIGGILMVAGAIMQFYFKRVEAGRKEDKSTLAGLPEVEIPAGS